MSTCLYSPACLGGINSDCAIGYEGLLCNTCSGLIGEDYYARSGVHKCSVCESPLVTWTKSGFSSFS